MPDYDTRWEEEAIAGANTWEVFVDRVNPRGGIFSSHEPVARILAREEGSRLDSIMITGPGNRALAINIELGEPGQPVRVSVTEDGYGSRLNLAASTSNLLAWEQASDGGDAVNLPITRADLEEAS